MSVRLRYRSRDATLSRRMKRRKTKANIFFLDCCRSFVYDETRGGSPKPMNFSTTFTQDTLYAHATAPGHTASDGHDGHGTMSRRGKGVYRVTSIDHHILPISPLCLPYAHSRLSESITESHMSSDSRFNTCPQACSPRASFAT